MISDDEKDKEDSDMDKNRDHKGKRVQIKPFCGCSNFKTATEILTKVL